MLISWLVQYYSFAKKNQNAILKSVVKRTLLIIGMYDTIIINNIKECNAWYEGGTINHFVVTIFTALRQLYME